MVLESHTVQSKEQGGPRVAGPGTRDWPLEYYCFLLQPPWHPNSAKLSSQFFLLF